MKRDAKWFQGKTKGATDEKIVPGRAILELRAKRKINNYDFSFTLNVYVLFIMDFFVLVLIFKIHFSKMLFILITEFVAVSLNFMPWWGSHWPILVCPCLQFPLIVKWCYLLNQAIFTFLAINLFHNLLILQMGLKLLASYPHWGSQCPHLLFFPHC